MQVLVSLFVHTVSLQETNISSGEADEAGVRRSGVDGRSCHHPSLFGHLSYCLIMFFSLLYHWSLCVTWGHFVFFN